MASSSYKYLFIKQRLTDILNKLGYAHFVTKDWVNSFIEGRAFYFYPKNKKYGYVDVIPYSEVSTIKENEQYLEKLSKFREQFIQEMIRLTDCGERVAEKEFDAIQDDVDLEFDCPISFAEECISAWKD